MIDATTSGPTAALPVDDSIVFTHTSYPEGPFRQPLHLNDFSRSPDSGATSHIVAMTYTHRPSRLAFVCLLSSCFRLPPLALFSFASSPCAPNLAFRLVVLRLKKKSF